MKSCAFQGVIRWMDGWVVFPMALALSCSISVTYLLMLSVEVMWDLENEVNGRRTSGEGSNIWVFVVVVFLGSCLSKQHKTSWKVLAGVEQRSPTLQDGDKISHIRWP
jgi:hypothetical protein